MAISPYDTYPGRTTTPDADYPYGAARAESSPPTNIGFPFSATWLQDIQGFFQALLTAAGLPPSGNPDTAQASQYLDALQNHGIIPLTALGVGSANIDDGSNILEIDPDKIVMTDSTTGLVQRSQPSRILFKDDDVAPTAMQSLTAFEHEIYKKGTGGFVSNVNKTTLVFAASIPWVASSGFINASSELLIDAGGAITWPIRLISLNLVFDEGSTKKYTIPITASITSDPAGILILGMKAASSYLPSNPAYSNHKFYLEYEQL